MKTGSKVRLGIAGMGNMGVLHARTLLDGKVPSIELVAVSDLDAKRLEIHPQLRRFQSSEEMIRSGEIDAILIATPHYAHTTTGIDALKNGLHVMVEKPISAHKADAERLIAAHQGGKQVFAAMFNQRTDLFYRKIRSLIESGELGEIRRVNWIITNWFRPAAYYASSGWRATWGGEGGGVLLNQCPHNLDLFQWLFGMPSRVRAFCSFGRYHDIEVEDDATAYFEFPNGATGVFITSTGEAPGTNRLEITAERGRLVYEDDQLHYRRNEVEMSKFSRTTKEPFSTPPVWKVQIPVSGHGGQYVEMLTNFAEAILHGKPLIAPASEGIRSLELANAIILSALEDRTVELPLDSKRYERKLKSLIAASTIKKKPVKKSAKPADMKASFAR